MNFQIDFPDYNPEQRELLNSICDKRREVNESLRELRKMFGALKTRIKKYEKKIAMLNEEKDKTTIMYVSSNVQLALNKYIPVQKNIKECSLKSKQFDKSFKALRLYPNQSLYDFKDNLNRISSPLNYCRDSILTAENELRIANKHLKKNDDHLAYIRKINRNYPMHKRTMI